MLGVSIPGHSPLGLPAVAVLPRAGVLAGTPKGKLRPGTVSRPKSTQQAGVGVTVGRQCRHGLGLAAAGGRCVSCGRVPGSSLMIVVLHLT